jgi:peptidoglycan/xylan/chitin deacetylase (PgdA/CDA1 family)
LRHPRAAALVALGVGVALVAAIALASIGGGSGGEVRHGKPAAGRKRARRAPLAPIGPGALRGDRVRRLPVPVLMYHVVAPPPPGQPFPDLYVDPGPFSAEMAALARAGYQAVTLRQAYDGWKRGAPLPRRPVVVSFDDGYRSQFRNAAPVLRSRRWPGVLNLKVDAVGEAGGLTAGQVRALVAAGWELDSHTITHQDLTTLPPPRVREEVSGSRATLRRRFGVPVDFFCYPSGRYDDDVVAAVRRAGYLGATTTDPGLARPSELFTLQRVRVHRTDTPATLLSELGALRGGAPAPGGAGGEPGA